jgi:hypothetical protein
MSINKTTIEGAGIVALAFIAYRIVRGAISRMATSMGFPFAY